jgi:hypothetical protein
MAGVLLWIGLVVGAASRKSDIVTKRWFLALAVRCSIFLCFDHPEGIHATMLRMGEMIEALGYATGSSVVEVTRQEAPRRESSGKRRKM